MKTEVMLRFNWYKRMGLLESACIVELKHAMTHWQMFMRSISK